MSTHRRVHLAGHGARPVERLLRARADHVDASEAEAADGRALVRRHELLVNPADGHRDTVSFDLRILLTRGSVVCGNKSDVLVNGFLTCRR